MPDRYVEDAVQRSAEAMVVLDRHKGALLPHILVLIQTFGPQLTRNIVSGSVEAAIIAWSKAPGNDAILDHCRDEDPEVIVPFEGEGR